MSMQPGVSITRDDADAFLAGVREVVAYRGDVTLVLRDNSTVMGYVYDSASLDSTDRARLRVMPDDGAPRVTIALADVDRIDVTGRDTAAGKSFETYIRRYAERLAAEHREAAPSTSPEPDSDPSACASS